MSPRALTLLLLACGAPPLAPVERPSEAPPSAITTTNPPTIAVGEAFACAIDAEQRRRATRAVAALSNDAQECAMLLDMLGLHPAEGRTERPAG